jgi:hypothetical protein
VVWLIFNPSLCIFYSLCAFYLSLKENLFQQFLMVVQIPVAMIAILEADVQVPIMIFLVESQPTFELHLQKRLCVEMLRDEIGPVSIVAKSDGQITEICQNS